MAKRAQRPVQQAQEMTTRAAMYVRVSTEDQAESGLGLDAQRTKCRAMAQVKDWEIVGEYADEGISGTVEARERPGMGQLLTNIEAGKIDAVIVAALDRLGRRATIILTLVDDLASVGCELVSCRESLDTTTAMGKFFVGISAVIAQLERDLISERTRAALAELAKQGIALGRLPLGYQRAGAAVEVEAQGAEVVRRIFNMRHGPKPYTLQQIADTLTAEGIPTPRQGRAWSPAGVKFILDNAPIYQGGQLSTSAANWPAILS